MSASIRAKNKIFKVRMVFLYDKYVVYDYFLPLKWKQFTSNTVRNCCHYGDVHGVSEIVLEEGEVSAQIPIFYKRQYSNFKNISILKELILPLNSIQKELIFNKKFALLDIPFGKTRISRTI
jgi:hypothetical protein